MGKVKTGRVTRSKQTIQSFERECKCKLHKVFAKQGKCLPNKESVGFSMSTQKITKSCILDG